MVGSGLGQRNEPRVRARVSKFCVTSDDPGIELG